LPLEGRRFNDLFGSSIKIDTDLVKAKLGNPELYFAEEAKYSAEGVENPGEADYNEDKVSKAVFDQYLNDGIMQMVRDIVAREIREHVNLAEMSDPVKSDAERDQLPYIRKMLVWFNTSAIQNNQAYKR